MRKIGGIVGPCGLILLLGLAWPGLARAIDRSIKEVNGHISRELLGDGTGVIIAILDTGIDDTHPALAGTDSLGRPRLVAEGTFVTYPYTNAPDDRSGHGTAVASVALARNPTYMGMAPDARYINAQVLAEASLDNIPEAVGFAIANGANILNASWGTLNPTNNGDYPYDLVFDWAADKHGVVPVMAAGNLPQPVHAPASSFNGISVGGTNHREFGLNFGRPYWATGATGLTSDGRTKPDIVAPANSEFGFEVANDLWETENDFVRSSGTSIAAPHVVGMLAQQIEAGRERGWSTDTLVLKATLMNSASKSVRRDRRDPAPNWHQELLPDGGLAPLDTYFGTGEIDGAALATQYLAGEQGPGSVAGIGWDLNSIAASQLLDYTLDGQVVAGSTLTATATWFRHVERTDRGKVGVDYDDVFVQSEPLDTIELALLRNGFLVATTSTTPDNVRHLVYNVTRPGRYTLRVIGANIVGAGLGERFGLAWSATTMPVPEPSGWLVLAAVVGCAWWGDRHFATA